MSGDALRGLLEMNSAELPNPYRKGKGCVFVDARRACLLWR